ncbi:hypothetical protein F7R12_20250 [Pseudomonas tolaasii]|nr:hypothetical protein F7R12_20250 [Pseudomonas tolaasii]
MQDWKTDTGRLSTRSSIKHLRMQRDERRLKSQGFLILQPNPFVDDVGIEAVAQDDVCGGGLGSEHFQ